MNPVAWAFFFLAIYVAIGLTTCSARADIVVTHDLGGPVEARMARIDRMAARGEAVRIPFGNCASACTLYLGLPNTCVGRSAVFGFHGPSAATTGLGLPLDEFERVSRSMALYYPAPIRAWFLSTARYTTITTLDVTGADLIALGAARECQP